MYGSTTATSAVGLTETHMVNTCVRENSEKPEAGLHPVSDNTRNQIAVPCVRHIQAIHMTPGEVNQAITIYVKESDEVLTI